jgi:hypothetical protein
MEGWIDGWMKEWMDEWMDGKAGGWKDERIVKYTHNYLPTYVHTYTYCIF